MTQGQGPDALGTKTSSAESLPELDTLRADILAELNELVGKTQQYPEGEREKIIGSVDEVLERAKNGPNKKNALENLQFYLRALRTDRAFWAAQATASPPDRRRRIRDVPKVREKPRFVLGSTAASNAEKIAPGASGSQDEHEKDTPPQTTTSPELITSRPDGVIRDINQLINELRGSPGYEANDLEKLNKEIKGISEQWLRGGPSADREALANLFPIRDRLRSAATHHEKNNLTKLRDATLRLIDRKWYSESSMAEMRAEVARLVERASKETTPLDPDRVAARRELEEMNARLQKEALKDDSYVITRFLIQGADSFNRLLKEKYQDAKGVALYLTHPEMEILHAAALAGFTKQGDKEEKLRTAMELLTGIPDLRLDAQVATPLRVLFEQAMRQDMYRGTVSASNVADVAEAVQEAHDSAEGATVEVGDIGEMTSESEVPEEIAMLRNRILQQIDDPNYKGNRAQIRERVATQVELATQGSTTFDMFNRQAAESELREIEESVAKETGGASDGAFEDESVVKAVYERAHADLVATLSLVAELSPEFQRDSSYDQVKAVLLKLGLSDERAKLLRHAFRVTELLNATLASPEKLRVVTKSDLQRHEEAATASLEIIARVATDVAYDSYQELDEKLRELSRKMGNDSGAISLLQMEQFERTARERGASDEAVTYISPQIQAAKDMALKNMDVWANALTVEGVRSLISKRNDFKRFVGEVEKALALLEHGSTEPASGVEMSKEEEQRLYRYLENVLQAHDEVEWPDEKIEIVVAARAKLLAGKTSTWTDEERVEYRDALSDLSKADSEIAERARSGVIDFTREIEGKGHVTARLRFETVVKKKKRTYTFYLLSDDGKQVVGTFPGIPAGNPRDVAIRVLDSNKIYARPEQLFAMYDESAPAAATGEKREYELDRKYLKDLYPVDKGVVDLLLVRGDREFFEGMVKEWIRKSEQYPKGVEKIWKSHAASSLRKVRTLLENELAKAEAAGDIQKAEHAKWALPVVRDAIEKVKVAIKIPAQDRQVSPERKEVPTEVVKMRELQAKYDRARQTFEVTFGHVREFAKFLGEYVHDEASLRKFEVWLRENENTLTGRWKDPAHDRFEEGLRKARRVVTVLLEEERFALYSRKKADISPADKQAFVERMAGISAAQANFLPALVRELRKRKPRTIERGTPVTLSELDTLLDNR